MTIIAFVFVGASDVLLDVLAKDVLKSLETEISEALQTRKRSSRLQQLLEWAEAIGKSSRITEAERK